MADTTVKGLRELQMYLNALPVKMEKNILRGALRQGANVVKIEAQAQLASNGNVITGELSKGLKVSTNSKGGVVTGKVKATGKHRSVAHWLEFGVKPHKITGKKGNGVVINGKVIKAVNHPGFRPKPFMRPALDGQSGAATVAVGEYIKARLATKHGIDVSSVEVKEE